MDERDTTGMVFSRIRKGGGKKGLGLDGLGIAEVAAMSRSWRALSMPITTMQLVFGAPSASLCDAEGPRYKT